MSGLILRPDDDDAPDALTEAAEAIVEAGRRMDQCRWVPATAGNLSVRLDDGRIAITRSGVHKGRMTVDDVIAVDMAGRSLSSWGRASVETPLHCQIYAQFPQAGAVLHGHSVAGTVLSMAHPAPVLTLAGYEMLKAFASPASLDVPVLDNDQDVARLVQAAAAVLADARAGYLVRGHGTYVWGLDLDTALVRLEALEFLLECELAKKQ